MLSLRSWIEQADIDVWAVLSAPFQAPPGWGSNMTPKQGDFRFRAPDGLFVTPLMLRDARSQEWIHLAVSRNDRLPTIEDLRLAAWLFGKPKSSVWLPLDDKVHDERLPPSRRNRSSVWIRCDGEGMPFADGEIDASWVQQVSRPPAPPPAPMDLYGRLMPPQFYGQQQPSFGEQVMPQGVMGAPPAQVYYGFPGQLPPGYMLVPVGSSPQAAFQAQAPQAQAPQAQAMPPPAFQALQAQATQAQAMPPPALQTAPQAPSGDRTWVPGRPALVAAPQAPQSPQAAPQGAPQGNGKTPVVSPQAMTEIDALLSSLLGPQTN